MGLLPPYARDGGSSRCQGLRRAGGAGRGRRERNGGQARAASGAWLSDQPDARPGLFTAAPNGLELTGDGGAAAGVRCSDVLGAKVLGLVAMGLLPPYARDGGSSRCQGVHRAGGAGRVWRERNGGQAKAACGARLGDQPNARPGLFTAAPNGLELTGDGGAAAGVRCSDVLGPAVISGDPRQHRTSRESTPSRFDRRAGIRFDSNLVWPRNRKPRAGAG
jgi:hypothetical protein